MRQISYHQRLNAPPMCFPDVHSLELELLYNIFQSYILVRMGALNLYGFLNAIDRTPAIGGSLNSIVNALCS